MKNRRSWKAWLRLALAIVLSSLGMVPAFAASAEFPPLALAPDLADHFPECDGVTWDPGAGTVFSGAVCLDHSALFRSLAYSGSVAWAQVAAGQETELRVFVARDGTWTRFPYLSSNATWAVQGSAYEEYLSEIEDASAGEITAPRVRGRTWAAQGDEAFAAYMRDLEETSVAGTYSTGAASAPVTRSAGRTWAVQGDVAFEEYTLELENESAGERFGTATFDARASEAWVAVPDQGLEAWLKAHDLMPDEDRQAWIRAQRLAALDESEAWLHTHNLMPDEDREAWIRAHE